MRNAKFLSGSAVMALALASGTPAFADAPSPAAASPGAAAATPSPDITDIVVTARRQTERLQDVPVAVSVLNAATLDSKGTFNPTDLVQSVPGLAVTASVSDRNNLTYTIRGQGFSYGTLFPAVITYFAEVPITQLTAGQFFDLASVEVLRGPQGVNFGRVTDGGNIMVAPQRPTNELGGYGEVKLGDYNSQVYDAALNIPIISDKVLFRGAVEVGRRDGFTTNVYNGQKLDNVAYESYRASLIVRPTDTIENYTVFAYQKTHDNGTSVIFSGLNASALAANAGSLAFLFNGPFSGAGGYGIDAQGNVGPLKPGMTPWTAANYVASQQAQLTAQNARGPRAVDLTSPNFDKRNNLYLVNTTTFNLTDDIQLKNVFGYVKVKDNEASNFGGANGGTVLTCHSACGDGGGLPFNSQEQISDELRLAGKSFGNKLTWALGAYADRQKPATAFENDVVSVGILQRDGVQYSKTTSTAGYGSAEFEILQGWKVNGGLRYTHDTVYSAEQSYLSPIPGGQTALYDFLTTAPAAYGGGLSPAAANYVVAATFAPIPHGKCTTYGAGSALYKGVATPCQTYAAAYNATTWTAGTSYKPNRNTLLYGKVSRGYRPGGVNGSAPLDSDPTYSPEFDTSFEIGAKADVPLGSMHLRTSIAAYHDRYTNIQKSIVVVLGGSVPASLIRNVDDATVQGVELEATLFPLRGLSIGGTFAYTDAKFDKTSSSPYTNPGSACDPAATVVAGFCPSNRFNATPEGQFTVHVDYASSLGDNIGVFNVGAVLYHQSSAALTDTSALRPNSVEAPYTTLDLHAELKNVMNAPVDLGFFMTNVTNKLYRIGANDITEASSLGVAGNIYAPPRMFGFSLKYRFGSDAK